MIRNYAMLTACILTLLFTTGCAKVAYYHTERVSIALEAKAADASQPVQGNIGVKMRTVVVSEGKKTSDNAAAQQPSEEAREAIKADLKKIVKTLKKKQAPTAEDLKKLQKANQAFHTGEAASVISDFRLQRTPGGEGMWNFGKTTISSAFITGEAAQNAPVDTAKALAGAPPKGILSILKTSILIKMYDIIELKAQEKDARATALKGRLDKLGKLLPDYTGNTYYQIDTAKTNLTNKDITGFDYTKDFGKVLEYGKLLNAQLTCIGIMEKDLKVTFAGNPIDRSRLAEILTVKKRVTSERDAFFKDIVQHPVVKEATQYASTVIQL